MYWSSASSSSSSPTWQLSRADSKQSWFSFNHPLMSWQFYCWILAEQVRGCRPERQRDTSFFYSLAELSKSHIFPSLFSPAFSLVIGHFSASFRLVGCLLPWPDPRCSCDRGRHFSRFTGGAYFTQPSQERAPLKERGTALKYGFSAPLRPLRSG